MEMQQVRYFLAVAKTLNFTRAAEQCNVTQPALTRAIKQLEDELGGELIRREGRLSHLSELGQRMLPLLTQCYESALNAKTLAAKVKAGEVASLPIGISLTFEIELLMGAFTELNRAFPGLQLLIRRGNGTQIAEWLRNGDIEVAVGGPLGESWERLDCWPMFTESFALAVANDHELAGVNDMELQVDLVRKERMLLHSAADASELTPASLEAAGIVLDYAHKVGCNRDLESMIAAGFGVAIMPASAMRSDKLRYLPFPALDLRRTVAVYSIAGRPRSREAAAMLALVRSADWTAEVAA